MLQLPKLCLLELLVSQGLLLLSPVSEFVLQVRLAFLLFFEVCQQLGIVLNFGILLLLLPVPLLI